MFRDEIYNLPKGLAYFRLLKKTSVAFAFWWTVQQLRNYANEKNNTSYFSCRCCHETYACTNFN